MTVKTPQAVANNFVGTELDNFYHVAVDAYIDTAVPKFHNFVSKEKLRQIFFSQNNIKRLHEYFLGITRTIPIAQSSASFLMEEIKKTQSSVVIELRKILKNIAEGFMNNIKEAIERTFENINNKNMQQVVLNDNTQGEWFLHDIHIADSDPHRNNRRVAFVDLRQKQPTSFWSGSKPDKFARVVYKPGDLSMESFVVAAKGSVMQFLEDKLHVKLPTYRVLNKEHYGFMQYLPHTEKDYVNPSKKQVEDSSYYYGVYAALSIIFAIDDRHDENMLISDFRPYMIDLETSFSVSIRSGRLDVTLLFLYQNGAITAFCDSQSEAKSLFFNSEEKKIAFDEAKFTAGFEQGLTEIARYADELKQLIDSKFPNDTRVRILPIGTELLYNARYDFADVKLFGSKPRLLIENQICANLKLLLADKKVNESQYNSWRVKMLVTAFCNIDGMSNDFLRGDIPYFSMSIKTGKIFNSDGMELLVDNAKLDKLKQYLLSEELSKLKQGYTVIVGEKSMRIPPVDSSKYEDMAKQKAIEIDEMIAQIKSVFTKKLPMPIDMVKSIISKLSAEYKQNGGDIKKTSLYGGEFGKEEDLPSIRNISFIHEMFQLIKQKYVQVEKPAVAVSSSSIMHIVFLLLPGFIISYFMNDD